MVIDFLRSAWNKLTPKNNIEKQLHVSIATSVVMELSLIHI